MTQLIPHKLTFYVSTALFAFFGLKLLYEAYHMSPDFGKEEYEEANAEVQKNELEMDSSKYKILEDGSSNDQNNTRYDLK